MHRCHCALCPALPCPALPCPALPFHVPPYPPHQLQPPQVISVIWTLAMQPDMSLLVLHCRLPLSHFAWPYMPHTPCTADDTSLCILRIRGRAFAVFCSSSAMCAARAAHAASYLYAAYLACTTRCWVPDGTGAPCRETGESRPLCPTGLQMKALRGTDSGSLHPFRVCKICIA